MNNFNEDIFSAIKNAADYVIQTGPYETLASKETRAKFLAAQELKDLELYHPSRLPTDSFEMWKKMTSNGMKLNVPIKKPGEVPKVTFSRFIKRKNEYYEKKRKEFLEKYGYDYKLVDFDNSNSYSVVRK